MGSVHHPVIVFAMCVVGRACLDTTVQSEFVTTVPRSFLPLMTNPAPIVDHR